MNKLDPLFSDFENPRELHVITHKLIKGGKHTKPSVPTLWLWVGPKSRDHSFSAVDIGRKSWLVFRGSHVLKVSINYDLTLLRKKKGEIALSYVITAQQWQIDERGVEVNVFGKHNKYICEKKKRERELMQNAKIWYIFSGYMHEEIIIFSHSIILNLL